MRGIMKIYKGALATLFALALFAAPAAASNYSIVASGVWHSQDGLLNGTWTANFDVAGYDLSGTLNLIGMPGVAEGNIAGSWDASDIGFGVMFLDHELAAFTGGLVGDKFEGTFESGDIDGIWTGALQSLTFKPGGVDPVVNENVPTLLLNRITGSAGEVKKLIAKLQTAGAPIVTVEQAIAVGGAIANVVAAADGSPACQVSSAIDVAQAAFTFVPESCHGNVCTEVRAVIETINPIVDGAQLFTCQVKIQEAAASGIYSVVVNALKAYDVSNLQIPIADLAGEIQVKTKKLLGGDCHCRTVDEAGTLPLASLLAPLALIAVRRRRAASSQI